MLVLGFLVGLLAGCCLLMAAGLMHFPMPPHIHERGREAMPGVDDPIKTITVVMFTIGLVLLLASLALLGM